MENNLKIIHVDMDAFYAAVEVRDDPSLFNKPLIIGSLPTERGVVATCSYEARAFGIRSAMNIKEAYRRCPHGIYMRPNMAKYKAVSKEIHKIWADYANVIEYISLDEGFLDVTHTEKDFGGAENIAKQIKDRISAELSLTCSVGVGYCLMAAKLASEEKKPNGLYQILSPNDLVELIYDRSVRYIPWVGQKTQEKLKTDGITLVKHVHEKPDTVIRLLGKNQGHSVIAFAHGIDNRNVELPGPPKSLGREHTFQNDVSDFSYLKNVLEKIAYRVKIDLDRHGMYAYTITLKAKYTNMKSVTRSRTASDHATNDVKDIYTTAASLLSKIENRPVRLIGISVSGLTTEKIEQISIFDILDF